MLNRLNTTLCVMLFAIAVASLLLRVDPTKPNIEILPDMKYSPAFLAFSRHSRLPHGRVLQAPPPGAIARGHLPLHYLATPADAIRAGEEIKNHYSLENVSAASQADGDDGATESPATNGAGQQDGDKDAASEPAKQDPMAIAKQKLAASVTRGEETFRAFCITCHGATGAGDGPVAKRGFPPPPSLLTGKSRQMKDGQIFHILTYGQGSMSGLPSQLPPEERWDVINYVRGMQASAPPIEAPAEAENGSKPADKADAGSSPSTPKKDPSGQ